MNEDFINELSKRVYDNLGEKFIKDLQLYGTPLPNDNDLTNHIRIGLNSYVSPEEQKKYLSDNLGDFEDDEVNSMMMKVATNMAALNVLMKIRRKLETENASDVDKFDWTI